MKKKLLSIFLILLLVCSIASCAPEEKEEAVTIVWYIPGDNQKDIDLVNEKLSEITMEKVGVKLKLEFIDLQIFGDRMAMNFAGGNDEFDLTYTGYVNIYHDSAMQGAYIPLDEYIENSKVIKEVVPDYVLESSKKDGHIYAIANMQVLPSNTALFIQKDLAEEYDLDTSKIRHTQDIEPFLEWVKQNHPEVYPFRTRRVGGGFHDERDEGNFRNCVSVFMDENNHPVAKTLMEGIDSRYLEYQYLNK